VSLKVILHVSITKIYMCIYIYRMLFVRTLAEKLKFTNEVLSLSLFITLLHTHFHP